MEFINLCDSCRKIDCGGYKQFDPMIGPTIGCPKYWPRGWAGIFLAPLYGFCRLLDWLLSV